MENSVTSQPNALPLHRIFRKARPRNEPPKYEQPGNQKQWKNYSDKKEMTQDEITEQINYEKTADYHYPKIAVNTRKKTRWIHIPTVSRQRGSHKHYKKRFLEKRSKNI